jgi:hypothetical protein
MRYLNNFSDFLYEGLSWKPEISLEELILCLQSIQDARISPGVKYKLLIKLINHYPIIADLPSYREEFFKYAKLIGNGEIETYPLPPITDWQNMIQEIVNSNANPIIRVIELVNLIISYSGLKVHGRNDYRKAIAYTLKDEIDKLPAGIDSSWIMINKTEFGSNNIGLKMEEIKSHFEILHKYSSSDEEKQKALDFFIARIQDKSLILLDHLHNHPGDAGKLRAFLPAEYHSQIENFYGMEPEEMEALDLAAEFGLI